MSWIGASARHTAIQWRGGNVMWLQCSRQGTHGLLPRLLSGCCSGLWKKTCTLHPRSLHLPLYLLIVPFWNTYQNSIFSTLSVPRWGMLLLCYRSPIVTFSNWCPAGIHFDSRGWISTELHCGGLACPKKVFIQSYLNIYDVLLWI